VLPLTLRPARKGRRRLPINTAGSAGHWPFSSSDGRSGWRFAQARWPPGRFSPANARAPTKPTSTVIATSPPPQGDQQAAGDPQQVPNTASAVTLATAMQQ